MLPATICRDWWSRDGRYPIPSRIAQDVARNLIESHLEHGDPLPDGIAPATKPFKNLE
ncbi:MAG: hypothetical protein PHN90_09065 [Methanothrix sp.]|nr:hypothetical protein [Methanothrix sp.]